jgi:hypothetical protein
MAVAHEMEIEFSEDLKRAQLIELIMGASDFDEMFAKRILEEMRAQKERELIQAEKERELIQAQKERELIQAEKEKERDLARAETEKERNFNLEMERLRVQAISAEAARRDSSSVSEISLGSNGNSIREKSLDEIIRTIRMLTVKVPHKPEGWNFFFSSLEKAFANEQIDQGLKAKILICLLGEKAANVLINVEADKYDDYDLIKKFVLKAYEISPEACLESFKKARRKVDETFVQYVSRLTSMWEYYTKLRGATEAADIN